MGVLAELFMGTHADALDRARVLDAGEIPSGAVPHVELVEIGPVDLEILGEIVARAVRFGTGDLEVSEIDLAHDNVHGLPPFLTEALAAVATARAEDEDLDADVARDWSREAELDADPGDLEAVLGAIVRLAVRATAEGRGLYLWTRAV